MERLFQQDLAGIPLDARQRFLKTFGELTPMEAIQRELGRTAARATGRRRQATQDRSRHSADRVDELAQLLEGPRLDGLERESEAGYRPGA
jgi:hypothetical protein